MALELYHQNEDGVVIYRTEDNTLQLDVQLAEETVWLAQQQMAVLFDTTKQNVSLHINNIFKEGELDKISVVKDYLTTAADGKKYRTTYYNLDVIISVGYRVKSKRGTQFRQWALKVIKRADNVTATIYTKKPSAQLQLDIQKHNAQYTPIDIITFDRSHDRFLCIDEMVYHLGASIKDLGKKWFAFCRMEMPTTELLQKIQTTYNTPPS